MGHVKRLFPYLLALGLIGPNAPAPFRHFSEFFAGERAISRALELLHYEGTSFDVRYNCLHNLLVPAGFLIALTCTMTTYKRGIIWWAPPCSTWVFMSRHSTGRSIDPSGSAANLNVQAQNYLVRRLVYLLTVCIKRGVFFVVEQPRSSIMWSHFAFRRFIRRWDALLDWATNQQGAWSLDSRKDTILFGYAPHLKSDRMNRMMTAEERKWMADGHTTHTTHYYTGDDGVKRSRGTNRLKKTQAYGLSFGCAHALAYNEIAPPTNREAPNDLDPVNTDDDSTPPPSLVDSEDSCLNDLKYDDPEYFCGSAPVAGALAKEHDVQLGMS